MKDNYPRRFLPSNDTDRLRQSPFVMQNGRPRGTRRELEVVTSGELPKVAIHTPSNTCITASIPPAILANSAGPGGDQDPVTHTPSEWMERFASEMPDQFVKFQAAIGHIPSTTSKKRSVRGQSRLLQHGFTISSARLRRARTVVPDNRTIYYESPIIEIGATRDRL